MGKAILFIILALVFLDCNSQNEFIDTNKIWNVLNYEYWYGADTIYYSDYVTNTIKFNNDTIIDSKNYKKVIQSNDSTLLSWEHIGYIRKADNKKIYYRQLNGSEEGLLYDFDLNINDTINIINFKYFDNLREAELNVFNIDTIELNGSEKLRFHLKSLTYPYDTNRIWIEGIGDIEGVLNSSFIPDTGYIFVSELLCYYENDTLVYDNPFYSTCYLNITNSIEEKVFSLEKILVYPNPIRRGDFIVVKSNINKTLDFKIVNICGSLIKTGRIAPFESKNLVIDDLPGIYILHINDKNISVDKRIIVIDK